jgi:hypothetical protein
MSDEGTVEEYQRRYVAAMRAVQAGVAMKMNLDGLETNPKHLRVGVNAAMVDSGALGKLLIQKGIITELEYFRSLAETAENEKKMYEDWLRERLGSEVGLA